MIRKITNKNGSFRYQARLKVKGLRLYRKFDSHQDATRWINEMRFNRDNRVTIQSKITIDDMFKNYLENAKNKGNAPSSIKRAGSLFKTHIKPFYGDFNMLNVSVNEHKAFITYLRNKNISLDEKSTVKLANASINRTRTLMYTMFSLAIKQRTFGEYLTSNPFHAITPMKEMNHRIQYWDTESINRFLESEKGSHYYPLWVLMLNTGIRVGEAVGIHSDQIDRSADILTVDRMFCMTSNSVLNKTKSGALRVIGLNDQVKKVIYPLCENSTPIFTNHFGRRLTSFFVTKKVLPEACARANVKYIGSHGFRHTFASHFMMNGGSIYDLQKILGHHDIKTTERYAHFSRQHIQSKSNIVGFEGNVIVGNFRRAA